MCAFQFNVWLSMHIHNVMHIYSSFSSETITWTTIHHPVSIIPFKGQGGPRVTIPGTIKDIFFLFFTSTIMDLIVEEMNRYAASHMGSQWTPITTTKELCAYMGFMLLMGLVKLSSIYHYWQRDEVFHYSAIAGRITRDRFSNYITSSTLRTISLYLHLVHWL